MDVRRLIWLVATLCIVATVTATPVAAQSVNREFIDQLNTQLLYVALPLTLFVELILLYAIVRFRNNQNPKPTAEDKGLEITWTVVTGIILLFVGVASYSVMASPYISPSEMGPDATQEPTAEVPEDAVVIDVVAYQYGWQFDYRDANITTTDEVVLPTDRDVFLRLTSKDVVHSFYVPELGVKQDTFPGQTTVIRTRVTESGSYEAFCTEFCGDAHAYMRANVTVMEPGEYDQWVTENAGTNQTQNGTQSQSSVTHD
jgi:cytochrome c oxidase subunit 2